MNTDKLNKSLASIDSAKPKNINAEIKKIFSLYSNLLEKIYEENVQLLNENQNLKNEIHKLKGEQGTPNIKANKSQNSNVSTDEDRRNAEKDDESNSGYKLNNSHLEKLQERGIPNNVLIPLESLAKKKFSTKEEFLGEVDNIIGEDARKQYERKLLKYAFYKKRKRKPKIPNIIITREEVCDVDKNQLLEDAVFTTYEDKVVQDIVIKTDKIKFRKKVYYSPSLGKTFTGKVPAGYEGEFGPGVNTQIVTMKYVCNMSEPKICETLRALKVLISSTYISGYLTKEKSMQVFHNEKERLYHAGLEHGEYHQIDDTSSRVNGQNKYVQILGNKSFTSFFTTDRKDCLTILDLLRFLEPRSYLFNSETFELLAKMNVYHATIDKVKTMTENVEILNMEEMNEFLDKLFPNPPKGKITRTRISEAAAIASYHQEKGIPIVDTLICDNAPQFKLITKNLGLCWVHDARYYKKLTPIIQPHKEELKIFQGKYWDYYKELHQYKKAPSKEFKHSLDVKFDDLFATQTTYDKLNDRIKKTKGNKAELLLVLDIPNIPLHNNLSENAARVQKRRQDVSLQTKTEAGTKAKDTMMSIVESCKKLGVNSFEFIQDRVTKTFEMPSLAELIKKKG